MAITVKSGAIAADTGNRMFLLNVHNTTYAITGTVVSGTDLFDLGLIANSSSKQTTTRKTYSSEDGYVQRSSYTYDLMTTGMLMQTDKELINFLADQSKGKTWLEGKYQGEINNLDQWIFKIVQLTPQYDSVRPDGSASNPYESTGIKLTAPVTFASTTMGSINSALGLTGLGFPTYAITIPVSASFVIEENTVT